MSTRRTKEWFDDESFWRELDSFLFGRERFAEANEQVDKVLELVRPKGKAVLDLCCGPGRWAIPLAKRRFHVTGVDRSAHLLNRARAKARAARAHVEWVRADMRDFIRPEAFDLALSLFTSFGYFQDKHEDLIVLRNIFASLRPGGALLMDLKGKETLARAFQTTSSHRLSDGSLLVERTEVVDGWSRIRNEWTLVRGSRAKTWRLELTLYSGQELRDRLEQAGFTEIKSFGSLEGEAYGPDSKRLVVVGRKPAATGLRGRVAKV